jgi:hypothetical protein
VLSCSCTVQSCAGSFQLHAAECLAESVAQQHAQAAAADTASKQGSACDWDTGKYACLLVTDLTSLYTKCTHRDAWIVHVMQQDKDEVNSVVIGERVRQAKVS